MVGGKERESEREKRRELIELHLRLQHFTTCTGGGHTTLLQFGCPSYKISVCVRGGGGRRASLKGFYFLHFSLKEVNSRSKGSTHLHKA